jgi:lysine-ketoglutarate reductase/saccharopine dehydrogenase-like protein (TIGR00300 family)
LHVQDFPYREEVEIRGHIIDSNILPRILDEITDRGGDYDNLTLDVGHRKDEPSYARMEVRAASAEDLQALIEQLIPLGVTPVSIAPARLEPAPADGVYPENFYSTTNLRTLVNLDGGWTDVAFPEMDCAILVAPDRKSARSITLNETRKGDLIVVGHEGLRVHPLERPRGQPPVFAFMGSSVSPEKPNPRLIREIAQRMRLVRAEGKRILLVGGPVLINTGAQPELVWLVEHHYIQAIFGGNGLATHDIEVALYGTSLGVSIEHGIPVEGGHEHHLRAINTIRRAGGIRPAVEAGVLTSGLMHACVKQGVGIVLAGSIRDDGPLPEVITDTQAAQSEMRRIVRDGLGMVLIMASMLHGIATGNLLPAEVTTVCVDIEPAVVTKLSDRGTFQSISVVADAGSFLRELVSELKGER